MPRDELTFWWTDPNRDGVGRRMSAARGRLVALTAKGKQVVDRAVVDLLANQERLLGALSAAERGKLGDYCESC
jgi:hypothetical protein